MSRIDAKLRELGLALPPPMQVPGGMALPFPWVSVRGDRVIISGHGPQNPDGSLAGPLGKVGADVTLDEGYELARKVGLSILGSLRRELGHLDRIAGWVRVFGMVNSAPPEIGRHARSAIGVAGLPFNIAVEIEAEVLLAR